MNKDLYIKLLEEHVDDLTTAAKIETVLTSRKNCLIKRQSAELATMKDLGTAQDELLSKVADTVLDCQDDLNDLQADWAADHTENRKTLEVIKEQNTRECDLNVRLQGKIAELEADNETLTDERDRSRNKNKLLRENLEENK